MKAYQHHTTIVYPVAMASYQASTCVTDGSAHRCVKAILFNTMIELQTRQPLIPEKHLLTNLVTVPPPPLTLPLTTTIVTPFLLPLPNNATPINALRLTSPTLMTPKPFIVTLPPNEASRYTLQLCKLSLTTWRPACHRVEDECSSI